MDKIFKASTVILLIATIYLGYELNRTKNSASNDLTTLMENVDSLKSIIDEFEPYHKFSGVFPIVYPEKTEIDKDESFRASVFLAGTNDSNMGTPVFIVGDSLTEDLELIGEQDTMKTNDWIGEIVLEKNKIGLNRRCAIYRMPSPMNKNTYIDLGMWFEYEVKK